MNYITALGEPTAFYTDMFGIDWPIYENSRAYCVVNCASIRSEVLEHIKTTYPEIEVIKEEGHFGWVELYIEEESQADRLKSYLTEKYGPTVHLFKDEG